MRDALERLMAKVQKDENGCWLFTATRRKGYGQFQYDGRLQGAHRAAYQLLVGPIPDGLVLDHLCRNPSCVNPAHLEPVTQRENSLRGQQPNVLIRHRGVCSKGHEMTEANSWPRTDRPGAVRCWTCILETSRRRDRRTA